MVKVVVGGEGAMVHDGTVRFRGAGSCLQGNQPNAKTLPFSVRGNAGAWGTT